MSSRTDPVFFGSITYTLGEDDFEIELDIRDKELKSSFDLTPYNDIKLFQQSTDFANNFPTGGIVLVRKVPFTDGILILSVVTANIPTPAGQYFGKIDFSDGSETVKSNQFDITVKRSLTS